MAKFPFNDLHSFKDYVGFVRLCAPDMFPIRDGVEPREQWTIDLAFDGLRFGLALARKEKGELPALDKCDSLVEEAFSNYHKGLLRDGYLKIQEMEKLLKRVPSQ
jgi:hypothetical protein